MTEAQIQSQLITWWRLAHKGLGVPDARLLMMIPNGAYFGAGKTARGVPLAAIRSVQMKRQGMVSGAPDLFLAVCRANMAIPSMFGGLWIEMKTPTGRLSPEQIAMQALLHAQGYAVAVAFGFDPAVNAIVDYLGGAAYQPIRRTDV